MRNLLLAVLAALLLASPSAADGMDCPPTFPGHPDPSPCPAGQTAEPSCLALARVNFLTGWNNYVRPFAGKRCNTLDAIAGLRLQMIDLMEKVTEAEFALTDLDEACQGGDVEACDEAAALRVWHATTVARVGELEAQVAVLEGKVAGYESGMAINLASITEDYMAATLACCGDGDQMLSASFVVALPEDCSAERLYRLPPAPVCTGYLNQQCKDAAQAQHYTDWVANCAPYATALCRKADDYAILLDTVSRLEAECLADPGSSACDLLPGLLARASSLAFELSNLDTSLQWEETIARGNYWNAMVACCEEKQSSAPLVVPAVSLSDCDTQYPGAPDLPPAPYGFCYDDACVAAAKAQHKSDWEADVKPYADELCKMEAEEAGYWNQIEALRTLIALDQMLCDDGDQAACDRVRDYQIELDQVEARLDGVEWEIQAWGFPEFDRRNTAANGSFTLAVGQCLYACY